MRMFTNFTRAQFSSRQLNAKISGRPRLRLKTGEGLILTLSHGENSLNPNSIEKNEKELSDEPKNSKGKSGGRQLSGDLKDDLFEKASLKEIGKQPKIKTRQKKSSKLKHFITT